MTNYGSGLVWGRFTIASSVCSLLSGSPEICPLDNRVIYQPPANYGTDRPDIVLDAAHNSHLVFREFKFDSSPLNDRFHYLRIDSQGTVTADCTLPRPANAPAPGYNNGHYYLQYPHLGITSWGGLVAAWQEVPHPDYVASSLRVDGTRYHIFTSVGYEGAGGTCPISWTSPTEVLTDHPPRIASWSDWTNQQVSAFSRSGYVSTRTQTMYTTPLVVNTVDDRCYIAYRTWTSSSEQGQLAVVRSADGVNWSELPLLTTKPAVAGTRAYQPTLSTSGPLVTAAWYSDRDSPAALPNARLRVYVSRFDVTYSSEFDYATPVSMNGAVSSNTFFPTPSGSTSFGTARVNRTWSPTGMTPHSIPFGQNLWGDHIAMAAGVGTYLPLVGWAAADAQTYVAWTDSSRITTSDTAQPGGNSLEVRGSRVDVTP
ncbi:MAG: hypothetical protein EPO42_14530 [Gallionellaceae bacterium]|nr:MAG: hypothetical protein EPO42_14530 [Gallionellaceae bacterium]